MLSIGDGDTTRIRQAGRAITVRLACIDAPETAQSPYGRSVAEVFSGVNSNLAMVEDGRTFADRHGRRYRCNPIGS